MWVAQSTSFAKGMSKSALTSRPSQSEIFSLVSIGVTTMMGVDSEADKPLHNKPVVRVLEMIKDEGMIQPPEVANIFLKVRAAIAMAQMGSINRPEGMMVDLAGLRARIDIEEGRDGIMPDNSLADGIDLFAAPHVYLATIGKFKGGHGVREHSVAMASESNS